VVVVMVVVEEEVVVAHGLFGDLTIRSRERMRAMIESLRTGGIDEGEGEV
jgi:hypothetical protein